SFQEIYLLAAPHPCSPQSLDHCVQYFVHGCRCTSFPKTSRQYLPEILKALLQADMPEKKDKAGSPSPRQRRPKKVIPCFRSQGPISPSADAQSLSRLFPDIGRATL